MTTPGAPTNLREDLTRKAKNIISLNWDRPEKVGGAKTV